MPAEVQVEDVEAGCREVVREASRGQVPRVPVLSEPMDEQDRAAGVVLAAVEPLPDHRERHASARDDKLLQKGRSLVAIDRLLECTAVKNQGDVSSTHCIVGTLAVYHRVACPG